MRAKVFIFMVVMSLSRVGYAVDEGWIDLFNGKDLTGWKQINGKAKFLVEDGVIVGTTATGPNSFLCTEKNYGDFELEFEVKIDSRLNSGVQVRSHSNPKYNQGKVHGYQVEIATPDHLGYSGGDAGSIWDESRRRQWIGPPKSTPEAAAAFKANEWNHFRIVCHGDSIKTWVNNVPVADIKDDMTAKGFIGLQVHSFKATPAAQVRWRRIRIRKLL